MSKSLGYNKKLNKIININEDCSGASLRRRSLCQSETDSESSECVESRKTQGSSDSEKKKFLKACRNKKTMRTLSCSSSKDERKSIPSTSQGVMGEIELAVDGTQRMKQKVDGSRVITSRRKLASERLQALRQTTLPWRAFVFASITKAYYYNLCYYPRYASLSPNMRYI
uniref:Uncharacterized protein n=1 Tax=Glossina pallidipes TaxID=7398 RepID=A0A1A9ZE88_GLOPL